MNLLTSITVVVICYLIALVEYFAIIGGINFVAGKHRVDKDSLEFARNKTFKVLKITGLIYFIPLVLIILTSGINTNITMLVIGLTLLSVIPYTKKILIPRLFQYQD